MFRSKVKKEVSSTEIALARMDTRLDQISSLYEPLAVRVANLETLAKTTPLALERDRSGHVGGTATRLPKDSPVRGYRAALARILRHVIPHDVRLLLSEHDEVDCTHKGRGTIGYARAERRQAELRKRIRAHGEIVAGRETPDFPDAIFRADAANKIAIIDVGAQDLVSEDHIYAPLQAAGATKVIGFEPLPDEGAVPRRADPSVEMLECFVGSGHAATFHVTQFDPASSLFEPNDDFLSQFVDLPDMCRTVSTFEVHTTRLDDVREITDCDFLKVDVQGGELDVLGNARRVLENTLVVHCEVEFAPVYKNQPLFADLDSFLRSSGFELVDIVNAGYNRYKALPGAAQTGSRLLWAEAIYFKSAGEITKRSVEKLLKAAYIAHVNYCMYDLAAHFLAEYDKHEKTTKLRTYSTKLAAFAGW